MKKLIFVLMVVGIVVCPNAFAAGDKTITSQKYVENQVATKQDKIPAVDTNTVITHTGTAGNIGEKGIYDSTGNYAEQQTSLVTAGDANTGINNALENEFVCIDWDTDGTCLIWKIKNTSPQQILPTGYTALEYIESTGKQYIDTGIIVDATAEHPNGEFSFSLDIQYTDTSGRTVFGYAANSDTYWDIDVNGTKYRNGPSSGNYSVFDRHIFYANTVIDINAEYPISNTTGVIIGGQTVSTGRDRRRERVSGGSLRTLISPNLYQSSAKIYGLKQYQYGTLVFNGIPARRDSDSKLGMYDLVSNTFFKNRGTGTFIAGPDLDVYIPSGN